jgi:hypothetical protein
LLAFQLSINGQRAGAFGFEDWSVLHASLQALRAHASRLNSTDEFKLHIGGIASNREPTVHEGVRVFKATLAPGDEVQLKIFNVAEADPPIKRYRSDKTAKEAPFTPAEHLQSEREAYERLKARSEPGT